tara:strand:- start:98 stop:781 length:684 start_codon:yes stop_codon:yes gene_type:complete
MKKFILLLIYTLTICSPIGAREQKNFNEIINSNSYTLKCMAYRKCKDGVKPINDISDIASSYPDSNFNIVADEFNRMLTSLKTIGVKVFLGDERYFPPLYRAVYSTKKNNIYLNEAYMSNSGSLIRSMRHEGWHVAQDCKDGMKNKTMKTIISEKYIPKSYHKSVEKIYADRPDEIEIEKGAYWAGFTVGMTEAALESCIKKEDKHVNEKIHQYRIGYLNRILRESY